MSAASSSTDTASKGSTNRPTSKSANPADSTSDCSSGDSPAASSASPEWVTTAPVCTSSTVGCPSAGRKFHWVSSVITTRAASSSADSSAAGIFR